MGSLSDDHGDFGFTAWISVAKKALADAFGESVAQRIVAFGAIVVVYWPVTYLIPKLASPSQRFGLWLCSALYCLAMATRHERVPEDEPSQKCRSTWRSVARCIRGGWGFTCLLFCVAIVVDAVNYFSKSFVEIGDHSVEVTAIESLVPPAVAAEVSAGGGKYCLLDGDYGGRGPDFNVAIRPSAAVGGVVVRSCVVRVLRYTPRDVVSYVPTFGASAVDEVCFFVPVGTDSGRDYRPDRVMRGAFGSGRPVRWKANDTVISGEAWTNVRIIPEFKKPGVYEVLVSLELTADMRSEKIVEWGATEVFVFDVDLLDESFGSGKQDGVYDEKELLLAPISGAGRPRKYTVVREIIHSRQDADSLNTQSSASAPSSDPSKDGGAVSE